jgi:hypothetical protein
VEIVSSTGAVAINLHRACLEIWTQEATDATPSGVTPLPRGSA